MLQTKPCNYFIIKNSVQRNRSKFLHTNIVELSLEPSLKAKSHTSRKAPKFNEHDDGVHSQIAK